MLLSCLTQRTLEHVSQKMKHNHVTMCAKENTIMRKPTFSVDMNQRILLWNKAIENMTGIVARKVINKHWFDVMVSRVERKKLNCQMHAWLKQTCEGAGKVVCFSMVRHANTFSKKIDCVLGIKRTKHGFAGYCESIDHLTKQRDHYEYVLACLEQHSRCIMAEVSNGNKIKITYCSKLAKETINTVDLFGNAEFIAAIKNFKMSNDTQHFNVAHQKYKIELYKRLHGKSIIVVIPLIASDVHQDIVVEFDTASLSSSSNSSCTEPEPTKLKSLEVSLPTNKTEASISSKRVTGSKQLMPHIQQSVIETSEGMWVNKNQSYNLNKLRQLVAICSVDRCGLVEIQDATSLMLHLLGAIRVLHVSNKSQTAFNAGMDTLFSGADQWTSDEITFVGVNCNIRRSIRCHVLERKHTWRPSPLDSIIFSIELLNCRERIAELIWTNEEAVGGAYMVDTTKISMLVGNVESTFGMPPSKVLQTRHTDTFETVNGRTYRKLPDDTRIPVIHLILNNPGTSGLVYFIEYKQTQKTDKTWKNVFASLAKKSWHFLAQ